MKYIDSEKLLAEIERQRDSALERQKNLKKIGQETVLNEMIAAKLNGLLSFIDSLQQEQPEGGCSEKPNNLSLPSDLDEAAEEYGRKEYSHAIHFWDEGLSKNKPEVMKEDFVAAFKAGAAWMAGQGVTREVEVKEDAGGYPYIDKHFELYDYDKDEPLFKAGDEVILQIRKKN